MIAGRTDAFALSGIAAGAACALPWAFGMPLAVPAVLGGLGASWLAWRNLEKHLNFTDTSKREGFVLHSDETFPPCMGTGGLRFGITKDNHRTVDIPDDDLMRHCGIIGQSGVGKTTLGEYLLWQQTMRGAGWLFIDAKLDKDTRDKVRFMADVAGRSEELYVLDLSNPDNSNTYNPVMDGDADEKASRLLNLIPSSEENPGSDYYRQSANQALSVIFSALDACNKVYHFGDLSLLLQSDKAMEQLERMTPMGAEKRALSIFLDQYRVRVNGKTQIDVKRLKEVLGGMSGRISMFAQGTFGKIFNIYNPEVNLYDVITQNKMLYVMLPTMGKDAAALNFGKMIMSDLRSAVSKVQALPKHARPNPPFAVLADEMGSYVMDKVKTLFEQARSAGIMMFPAFQSFSQLNQVSPDFADIIIQNTWNKVFFKFGSVDSTETAVELLGKQIKYMRTVGTSRNEGDSAQAIRTTPQGSESDGAGVSENFREDEGDRVSPDQLRALGKGEALMISGARVYHISTPMMLFPNVPEFEAIHRTVKIPNGLDPLGFEARYEEFLTTNDAANDARQEEKAARSGKTPPNNNAAKKAS